MEMPSHGPQALHYAHVATWTGALQFAQVTKDEDLRKRLVDRFDPFLAADAPRVPRTNHVDAAVFGSLPLELYMQERRFRYRVMGLAFADAQWDDPMPDGLTRQTRWWIDDMYMITALQLQAYRATGDAEISRARARTRWSRTSRKLQQPNGLFYHAPDVKHFWGRGDGWVAAGMTELLRDLPEKHKARKPRARGVSQHDGHAAHAPGGQRHVAPDHRSCRRAGKNPRAPPCSRTRSSRA